MATPTPTCSAPPGCISPSQLTPQEHDHNRNTIALLNRAYEISQGILRDSVNMNQSHVLDCILLYSLQLATSELNLLASHPLSVELITRLTAMFPREFVEQKRYYFDRALQKVKDVEEIQNSERALMQRWLARSSSNSLCYSQHPGPHHCTNCATATTPCNSSNSNSTSRRGSPPPPSPTITTATTTTTFSSSSNINNLVSTPNHVSASSVSVRAVPPPPPAASSSTSPSSSSSSDIRSGTSSSVSPSLASCCPHAASNGISVRVEGQYVRDVLASMRANIVNDTAIGVAHDLWYATRLEDTCCGERNNNYGEYLKPDHTTQIVRARNFYVTSAVAKNDPSLALTLYQNNSMGLQEAVIALADTFCESMSHSSFVDLVSCCPVREASLEPVSSEVMREWKPKVDAKIDTISDFVPPAILQMQPPLTDREMASAFYMAKIRERADQDIHHITPELPAPFVYDRSTPKDYTTCQIIKVFLSQCASSLARARLMLNTTVSESDIRFDEPMKLSLRLLQCTHDRFIRRSGTAEQMWPYNDTVLTTPALGRITLSKIEMQADFPPLIAALDELLRLADTFV
eukprot:gnl/Spiro4/5364_TR2728_c0_g1_i1.p1 gnl/Spiro4/5364_TR2728_c0_g1~~gnl/Spiro4/5364_TR2728_c0_g1_i1.p1  ORF type:complete len:576 (+),score=107.53 gnl/Spiro4/5364_TR2728_c0_g1_i1:73-1800(+)